MLGFEFIGYAGNGHPKYHNSDVGVTMQAALTPSDWRSQNNTLARMERYSGRKLPRGNSGRHTHKPVRAALDTRLTDVEQKSLDRIEVLLQLADQIRDAWEKLVVGPANRTTAADARDILYSYEQVRSELEKLHRIIPPLSVA